MRTESQDRSSSSQSSELPAGSSSQPYGSQSYGGDGYYIGQNMGGGASAFFRGGTTNTCAGFAHSGSGGYSGGFAGC